MTLEVKTDEALAAEAAREGSDGPAFAELVRRYRDRVWRICFRLLGNEADAHDAAQEVCLRMFLQRTKFEGRSRYATWVHGIAARTALAIRRGRGRREKRVQAAEQPLGMEPSNDNDRQMPGLSLDLEKMLGILDEEDRALVILKYAEDYSHEELAEMFHLSESACKMRISRAKEKLKQAFPDAMQE